MGLNKARGDMYDFISHTWNPIKGRCPHQCSYCYVDRIYKRFKREMPPLYLDKRELETNLGIDKFIFVGSSTDMWAKNVPDEWIGKVLERAFQSRGNFYLFQTKNPARFNNFKKDTWGMDIYCTTLESNRDYPEIMGNAPSIRERIEGMAQLKEFRRMITIEPILDFDLIYFMNRILFEVKPFQVNIGADSGGNKLPEPPKEKILALIDDLKSAGIRVVLKKNLTRLIGEGE